MQLLLLINVRAKSAVRAHSRYQHALNIDIFAGADRRSERRRKRMQCRARSGTADGQGAQRRADRAAASGSLCARGCSHRPTWALARPGQTLAVRLESSCSIRGLTGDAGAIRRRRHPGIGSAYASRHEQVISRARGPSLADPPEPRQHGGSSCGPGGGTQAVRTGHGRRLAWSTVSRSSPTADPRVPGPRGLGDVARGRSSTDARPADRARPVRARIHCQGTGTDLRRGPTDPLLGGGTLLPLPQPIRRPLALSRSDQPAADARD